jgi:hypothetical protein
MLTTDQASTIVNEIIRQAQLSRMESQLAPVRPVPPLYRCRALSQLPHRQRMAVLREAKIAVDRNGLFLFLLFALVGIISGGFYWFAGPHRSTWIMPGLVGCWSAALLLRAAFIRREVRMIAAQLQIFNAASD